MSIENQINDIMYSLYGLTKEEIEFIENKEKNHQKILSSSK
jgi:hypothetical protein